MKIQWFFAVILLLFVNFTLIESRGGHGGRGFRVTQHVSKNIGRHSRNQPRSSSGNLAGNGHAGNANKWVEPIPPISPDHPSMQQSKRLNYLASNRKEARSNVGRLLSGS
ncbi:hypothetical protein HA402_004507 [Bradysia odoriphaga]|nr:hypothetical protein HA402_004507 [Bradysia odoriphaga]